MVPEMLRPPLPHAPPSSQRHVPDHHRHFVTAHLEPGVCVQDMQSRGQRPCATRLGLPSPQGHHHDLWHSPNEWLTLLTLQYLSLKWSQPNILLHEDWFIYFLTSWRLRGGSPLLCSTIPSHTWIFYHSAPPAQ